jgi:hypothetical protein
MAHVVRDPRFTRRDSHDLHDQFKAKVDIL